MGAMHRIVAASLAVLLAAPAAGCVTGMGLVKHNKDVSTANLVEAVAVDLAGFTYFMFAAENQRLGASALIGTALTGADFGIACLLGTCQTLHP